jgi:hypothetical protein
LLHFIPEISASFTPYVVDVVSPPCIAVSCHLVNYLITRKSLPMLLDEYVESQNIST